MASRIFNSNANGAFKKQFEHLTSAVRQQDMQVLDRLLPEVMQSPCYGRGKYKQMLVQAALNTDNKDILMKVLDGKPDFVFSYPSSDSAVSFHTESLLYKSLKEGRYKIARFLAQHPEVDISAGSNKYGMGYSHCNSPSTIARQNGRDDIAEVIGKRLPASGGSSAVRAPRRGI